MIVPTDRIERDHSIQCRAATDMETLNEYAGAMQAGAQFPPVVLYGDSSRYWIGDGWHRVLAAEQIGADTILAEVRPGGRQEALRHALGANSSHGHRRTNADKRRCVEIALKEFSDLSSRQIAELCGVSKTFATSLQPNDVATVATSTRTDTLGRRQPAKKPRKPTEEKPTTIFPRDDESAEDTQTKPTETDKQEEPTKNNRQRGSNDDWLRLLELETEIGLMSNEIETLRPDRMHKFPARLVCEKLAERFTKLGVVLVS